MYKIKREKKDMVHCRNNEKEEHDLAYYIHDRVELMHQVFSIIKSKDIKAMAPECVRHICIRDLEELCLEELLGISSKRLCAIMDGAEPPSDTESSSPSPERMETISLDSISSDDEILSQSSSKKKKHKHHHRSSKSRSKHKKKSKTDTTDEKNDQSKASRAGLTVLELLELQARARAIRAQLQQEQVQKAIPDVSVMESSHVSSDNEVEIKEEPPEVVEISSEDEKPNINLLNKDNASTPSTSNQQDKQEPITKKVNNLIITVPQTKPSRKIKLNRNKVTVSVSNPEIKSNTNKEIQTTPTKELEQLTTVIEKEISVTKNKQKDRTRKKIKRKNKKKSNNEKEGSDHDEIMLQLSDSEKMDLLEDLDHKNYDKVSSSSPNDSESTSSDSDSTDEVKGISNKLLVQGAQENANNNLPKNEQTIIEKTIKIPSHETTPVENTNTDIANKKNTDNGTTEKEAISENNDSQDKIIEKQNKIIADMDIITSTQNNTVQYILKSKGTELMDLSKCDDNITENNDNNEISKVGNENFQKSSEVIVEMKTLKEKLDSITTTQLESNESIPHKTLTTNTTLDTREGNKSEGELSEHESSEIEAVDIQPQVVCISDDEKSAKKKKKKDKKSKKCKKNKKPKFDYEDYNDQRFTGNDMSHKTLEVVDNSNTTIDLDNYENICEILELSDDSSCYEVEGVSVLSKEPTTEEIEALSAKIDEIERVEVVTDEQVKQHDMLQNEIEENISWKDRYLSSKKVKNILTTSNILNAMRKKNIELKNKIENSKKVVVQVVPPETETRDSNLEEGTIEHYNTLQGSTKYVDPILDPSNPKMKEDDEKVEKATNEMKKDAKQLLKMYKRLLKYNDINKVKNPHKKKKKKLKKNKEKDKKTEDV